MKIITVATRKGGAAKTTTAVHLAAGLAQQGAQVLLVDKDSQGQCATWLGKDPAPGVAYVVGQKMPLDAALPYRAIRPHLDLLPSNQTTIRTAKAAERDHLPLDFFRTVIEDSPTRYDYVVFDTPPLGIFQEMALHVADCLIIPTPLDALSVEGVRAVLDTAAEVRQGRAFAQQLILPTFHDRTAESGYFMGLLEEVFPGCIAHAIPRRVAVREAVAVGQTLYEYAPTNEATIAYAELASSVSTSDEETLFNG